MSAPRRPRFGTTGSIPTARSGAAVMGPTATVTSEPSRQRALSRSSAPAPADTSSPAGSPSAPLENESSHAETPGADVNTMASASPSAALMAQRASSAGSAGGPHLYTMRLSTSAPASANCSSRPSAPEPWCWSAMRAPSTPSARRNCASSAEVSDSATQSALRPAAWIAPRAPGPVPRSGHGRAPRRGLRPARGHPPRRSSRGSPRPWSRRRCPAGRR